MDLVTLAPRASAEERAAVDGVLGLATTRWDGGDRDGSRRRPVLAGRSRGAGPAGPPPAGLPRHPGPGRLDQPAGPRVRLPAPHGPARRGVRRGCLLPDVLHHCRDRRSWPTSARTSPAGSTAPRMSAPVSSETLGPAGEPVLGGEATWLRTPCLGRCERGPAALFTVAGLVPETIAAAPVDAASDRRPAGALAGRAQSGAAPASEAEPGEERLANVRRSIPQAGEPGLRLLGRVGVTDPHEPRRLPCQRRLPGPAASLRDRARGRSSQR